MIKIYSSKTKEEAGLKAAKSFAETLAGKPDAVLGLATGSSPSLCMTLLPICIIAEKYPSHVRPA